MSYVYVIQAEGGPVKIGIARDPVRRLAALKTGTPYSLQIAHTVLVHSDRCAAAVEREVHTRLSTARVHGEWFNVAIDEAREAVQAAIHKLKDDYPEFPRSPSVTPAQSRGARGLLNWSQVQLATAAQVSVATVRNFEAGRAATIMSILSAIRGALEGTGIEFLGNDGVRLRSRP